MSRFNAVLLVAAFAFVPLTARAQLTCELTELGHYSSELATAFGPYVVVYDVGAVYRLNLSTGHRQLFFTLGTPGSAAYHFGLGFRNRGYLYTPDGRYYADFYSLARVNMSTGERIDHPTFGGQNASQGGISDDGRYICYIKSRDVHLWNVETGTIDTFPASGAVLVTMNPAATRLCIQTSDDRLVVVNRLSGAVNTYAYANMSVVSPISVDGRFLVINQLSQPRRVNLDDGTLSPPASVSSGGVLSENGRYFLSSVNTGGLRPAIADFETGTVTPITYTTGEALEVQPLYQGLPAFWYPLAVSNDGTALFSRRDGSGPGRCECDRRIFHSQPARNVAEEVLALDDTGIPGKLFEGDETEYRVELSESSQPYQHCGITFDPDDVMWSFGDGTTTARGAAVRKAFRDDGDYTVRAVVANNYGATAVATRVVRVRNVAPTPDAGPDEVVTQEPGAPVPARFAGSFVDPGTADTHTIEWDFGDGSKSTGSLTPVHAYTRAGTYTATLRVTDDDGGVGTSTVQVRVNTPPIPSAGRDIFVGFGCTVTLDASASSEPDGDAVTYSWRELTGTLLAEGIRIDNADKVQARFNSPARPAELIFEVTVSDGAVSRTDEVLVRVRQNFPCTGVADVVADAGADVTIRPGEQATLEGSAVGGVPPYSYLWTPPTGLNGAAVARPIASPEQTTTYTLRVVDSIGLSDVDTVTLTVSGTTPSTGGSGGGSGGADPQTGQDRPPGATNAPGCGTVAMIMLMLSVAGLLRSRSRRQC